MTIVYGWAFLQQLGRFATQNSFLPYTRSSYQHTTPIPHIAHWMTRPFWAALMMSRGMPLFCTEILLRPFAACGCSLQEACLLYNAYDSKVVLNLPTAYMPSLQHTITLSKYNTPLSTQMNFARHGHLLQHSRQHAWFGRNRILCSTYTTLNHMSPLGSTWCLLCSFVPHTSFNTLQGVEVRCSAFITR